MRRILIILCGALLLAPASLVGQQTTEQQRREQERAKRDSLENEIVQRFVRRLSDDLQLTDAQIQQVQQVLLNVGVERRELSRASSTLRNQIYRAVRDSATADAQFVRLLAEYDVLRTREHELWRREQSQLAAILSPRQRAHFFIAWARFQDDLREIIWRRMREGDNRGDGDRRGDGRQDPEHRHEH